MHKAMVMNTLFVALSNLLQLEKFAEKCCTSPE